MTTSVTATADGPTTGIRAADGRRLLHVQNAAWAGEAAVLECSPNDDAGTYAVFRDSRGLPVVFLDNKSQIVPVGLFYRLNVERYAGNGITLSSHQTDDEWEKNRFR